MMGEVWVFKLLETNKVAALRRLYRNMQARVQMQSGVSSRDFQVLRGVRLGDPLSPALFNLVLTSVLAGVSSIW